MFPCRLGHSDKLSQVKLQEAIEYEDLQRENTPKTVALNLKKSDRYSLSALYYLIVSFLG